MSVRNAFPEADFPPISGQALRDKVKLECCGRQPYISFRNSQVNFEECEALAYEMNLEFIAGDHACGFYQKPGNSQERLAAKRGAGGVAV